MKTEQQQPDRLLLHTRWPWHMDAGLSGEQGRVTWAYLVFDNSRRYFIEKGVNQLSFISFMSCLHCTVQVLCIRLIFLFVSLSTELIFLLWVCYRAGHFPSCSLACLSSNYMRCQEAPVLRLLDYNSIKWILAKLLLVHHKISHSLSAAL